jgi:hypothetical protein
VTTQRFLWLALSTLLSWAGTYLLLDSIRHPGTYAEEVILAGGTLFALGLVAVYMAFVQHLKIRALARHMRAPMQSSRIHRTRRSANSPHKQLS